jgi:hypothetical protein
MIWGSDIGLFGSYTPSSQGTYTLLNPVATGTFGPPFMPPYGEQGLFAAANHVNTTGAFVGMSGTLLSRQTFAFTADLAQNTFTGPFNLNAVAGQHPTMLGVAQNTQTGSIVVGLSTGGSGGSGEFAVVDPSSGAVSSFAGVGPGGPVGMAIDSNSNKMVSADLGGNLSIYDLTTQSGFVVDLLGRDSGVGFYSAADSTRSLFLVEAAYASDSFTNNNSLSTILVYDEQGNLKENIERFNFFNAAYVIAASGLIVAPARRVGYTFGNGSYQLEPFTY